jgi:nucleotide-binding universal stress UspA family protein
MRTTTVFAPSSSCKQRLTMISFVFVALMFACVSFNAREATAWSFFGKGKGEKKEVVHSSDDARMETQFDKFPDGSIERNGVDDNDTKNNFDDDDDGDAVNEKERKKRERREKKRLKKLERERERKEQEREKRKEEQKLREGESPAGSLHEAIDDDDFDELEDLLKWKPNLKEPCKRIGQTKDYTPIMKAAHLGRAKMIDLLLDYGANPNELDSIGYSVLMRAVMSKDLESVKVLVEAGAIVTYVQRTAMMDLGLSAMKLAQMTGRQDMVEVLKEAGANPNLDLYEKREQKKEKIMQEMEREAQEKGIPFDSKLTADKMNVKRGDDDIDILIQHDGKNETVKGSENVRKWRDDKIKEEREKANMERAKEAMFGTEEEGEEEEVEEMPENTFPKEEL